MTANGERVSDDVAAGDGGGIRENADHAVDRTQSQPREPEQTRTMEHIIRMKEAGNFVTCFSLSYVKEKNAKETRDQTIASGSNSGSACIVTADAV